MLLELNQIKRVRRCGITLCEGELEFVLGLFGLLALIGRGVEAIGLSALDEQKVVQITEVVIVMDHPPSLLEGEKSVKDAAFTAQGPQQGLSALLWGGRRRLDGEGQQVIEGVGKAAEEVTHLGFGGESEDPSEEGVFDAEGAGEVVGGLTGLVVCSSNFAQVVEALSDVLLISCLFEDLQCS